MGVHPEYHMAVLPGQWYRSHSHGVPQTGYLPMRFSLVHFADYLWLRYHYFEQTL